MDHRKEFWSKEMDCIRKGMERKDGYETTISKHYMLDRYGNDEYPDRVFDELDIFWAIAHGRIVEGFDRGEKGLNRDPERTIVGPAMSGDWAVAIVLIRNGKTFLIKTVFPADRERYTRYIPAAGNSNS